MTGLAAAAPRSGGSLVGAGTLTRLGLRRERIPLVVWVYGLCAVVIASFPTLERLYPDEASRRAVATGIATNPAFLILTGPVHSTSIGGLTAWRYGVLAGLMVGLMAIFTVVRRTRAEEESGRMELLAAGVMGRSAPLAAAMGLATGASILIGLVIAAGSIALGQDPAGSMVLGASIAGPGLVFAAVAAVTAQLMESARAATALAGTVLGVTFALRAVADASPNRLGALAWLSPTGWTSKMSAYADDRWAVGLLFLAVAAALTMLAVGLQGRRDVGLGIFAARLGAATGPRLRSPLALAGRIQRGSLIGWAVALIATGAISGAIAPTAGDLLKDTSEQMLQIIHEMGGAGALSKTMLVVMAGLAGILAAVYSIGAALRMSSEESGGRAEPVLATAVGRTRWAGGHVFFAAVGPAAALTLAGVATGLVNGAGSSDFGAGFADGLVSMVVQIPAALVMGSLAVLLFGLAPRATSLAWAAVVVVGVVGELGPMLKLPRWLMDISPFAHVPGVPAAQMHWTPMVVLVLVAVVFAGAGLVGLRRRDLRSS